MLTLLLIGPTLVAASVPDTEGGIVETLGSVLVGLLIGGMLSVVVAYFARRGRDAGRAQGHRMPAAAPRVDHLSLSPMWMAALSTLNLDLAGLVVLVGVLPGAVRLGFGYLELPSSRTGDLAPPPSDLVDANSQYA